MLTLDMLKHTRIAKDFRRSHLAALVAIPEDRLRELELRKSEPWFDEAVLLARALCVEGILPLLTLDDIPIRQLDDPLPTDLDVWRSGVRPPLSLAVRVAIAFGLPDPCLLSVSPLQRQLWAVMEASERHPEAPGWCPWCAADVIGGDKHLPTCLPNNLWSPPEMLRVGGGGLPAVIPRPRQRVQRSRGILAHGLRALREERELKQADVAAVLGISANHYARVERAEVALTVELADRLAERYGVDRSRLYARPGAGT